MAHPIRTLLLGTAIALPLVLSTTASAASSSSEKALLERIEKLEKRVQRLDDVDAITKLTRIYGYYVDKQLWDQVVDLFSDDCVIEIAGRGIYNGKKGASSLFLGSMGQGEIGLKPGSLFNHMILQGVVDVDSNGTTAQARWRAFVQIAQYQKIALWSEGTYENTYVKQGGIWKLSGMHFYATYYTPFDQGWAKASLPNNGPSKANPPDAPQSVTYDVFPGHYVPPFHYPNPVTGRPWTIEDSRKYSTSGMSPAPLSPPGGPPPAAPATPNSR